MLLRRDPGPLRLKGRKLVFVGGKGGVGKTTTAAALALRAADAGERVLLVSTDPAHSLGDLFDLRIGDRKREIQPGLQALEIDPEAEVDRYLGRVQANMRQFVRPAMYSEIERQIELTRHSPGAVEAALMDRLAELMGEAGKVHDRVVFDTAPTGHTLRLLSLPEVMAAWTDGLLRSRDRSDSMGRALDRLTGGSSGAGGSGSKGAGTPAPGEEESPPSVDEPGGDDLSWFDDPKEERQDSRTRKIREVLLERRRKFSRARRLLLDRNDTAFLLVLVPEKLPILESEKAVRVLRHHRVPLAGLVVNRVLPEGPLGDFLESRRAQEAAYLKRIDGLFGDLPRVQVPLFAKDVEGVENLRRVAAELGVTLG